MGIYVNPGNEEFKRAVNSKIYVDKTMLLAFTNHQPSPPFRKIHGGKYAGGILWKRG